MISQVSNDTLVPRYGHTASRYFNDMSMPFLPKYLKYVYEQDTYKSFPVGTPMMSHDSNDTMFPWCGALPLVWTYVASRSFDDKNMPFLPKSLNYVYAQGAYKTFPNVYPMELL